MDSTFFEVEASLLDGATIKSEIVRVKNSLQKTMQYSLPSINVYANHDDLEHEEEVSLFSASQVALVEVQCAEDTL